MRDPSESLVASIALALNSARIPCVLWGHQLLQVHGVPSIVASIDFVIPDRCLSTAIEVLVHLDSVDLCSDLTLCPTSSPYRQTPPPSFHVHVQDSDVTVCLYLQSETLWSLEPLDQSLASPNTVKLPSPFILASDQTILPPWRPGRGSGFLKPGLHPVIIPKSNVLLEAFMRLYARDWDKRIGVFGMAMIAYIEEYVDDDGFLEMEQLPEPLLTFYKELREGVKPVRQWTEELEKAVSIQNPRSKAPRYIGTDP